MGFSDAIRQFNWIDVLIVAMVFRSAYIGAKQGVVVETFKLSAFVFISFFTLHYYAIWGDFLSRVTPVDKPACNVFSYLAISSLILVIFKFSRRSLLRVVRIEVIDLLGFWGGLFLGFIRGFFVSSLICLFFFVFNNDYFKGSVQQSFLGKKVLNVSLSTYKVVYHGLIIKFNPNSKLNDELLNSVEG